VRGGRGTIGYVDAARTPGFGTVGVVLGDTVVEYSPEAAAAIVDASPFESGRTPGDLAVSIDRTPDIPAYPIVLISYMIACEQYSDVRSATLVRDFLTYVIGPEGQEAAASAAGSAPVSESLRARMSAAIDLIEVSE
jgi:phosphate transport system substrate-binding protein